MFNDFLRDHRELEFIMISGNHDMDNGKHWKRDKAYEDKMDHITKHPLVQKFVDFHGNTGYPPHDYQQKKNMGVFEHPDGSRHIVARDHGCSTEVTSAYADARKEQTRKAERNRRY
jgi:hypothetical protein